MYATPGSVIVYGIYVRTYWVFEEEEKKSWWRRKGKELEAHRGKSSQFILGEKKVRFVYQWMLRMETFQYQFFMLMSMLTITLLKSRYSSLKLIQDRYPELFTFFRAVILKLIWGKLQRSPSPLPTYLKSKRLVNTHVSWSVASEVHAAWMGILNSCSLPLMHSGPTDPHARPSMTRC